MSRARADKGEVRLSVQEYAAWAVESTLDDAGLEKKDLDGQGLGVIGTVYPHSEIYSGEVAQDLGISPKLLISSDAGGSAGGSLLHEAGIAVSSGEVDLVLCLGADTPMNITAPGAMRTWMYESDFQKPFGMMGPNSQFAMVARRHMHQYGTKAEHLGKVAVTQREHAIRNPNAYLKSPLTMEQYLGSRMIADPVRLFDACISVNGGLAFVVASKEKAKQLNKDKLVWVLGSAEANNYQHGSKLSPDITYLGTVYSFTIIRQVVDNSPAFNKDLPFAIGLIELEEGPRIYSNLTGVNHEEISIGDDVTVYFDDVAPGISPPKFRVSK